MSTCAAPVVKDKNAVIDPAKASQTTFTFGEKVNLQCKKKVDNEMVTSGLMCTTDGKYEGMEMMCGIGTKRKSVDLYLGKCTVFK